MQLVTALWGVHDRQLTLRKQLYDMLTNGAICEGGGESVERGRSMVQAFKRRWRYNQEAVNKQVWLNRLIFEV